MGRELRFDGLHCVECGYDLRGLRGATCPECGCAFDPDIEYRLMGDPPRAFGGHAMVAMMVCPVIGWLAVYHSVCAMYLIDRRDWVRAEWHSEQTVAWGMVSIVCGFVFWGVAVVVMSGLLNT